MVRASLRARQARTAPRPGRGRMRGWPGSGRPTGQRQRQAALATRTRSTCRRWTRVTEWSRGGCMGQESRRDGRDASTVRGPLTRVVRMNDTHRRAGWSGFRFVPPPAAAPFCGRRQRARLIVESTDTVHSTAPTESREPGPVRVGGPRFRPFPSTNACDRHAASSQAATNESLSSTTHLSGRTDRTYLRALTTTCRRDPLAPPAGLSGHGPGRRVATAPPRARRQRAQT